MKRRVFLGSALAWTLWRRAGAAAFDVSQPLSAFVAAAVKTPLLFEPGTRYSYSSMAILLATEIAQRISGRSIAELAHERIFQPLRMSRSAMGLGAFDLSEVVMNQVERAAPESGSGDPSTKSWDWNSGYWRNLGAPS